MKKAKGCFFNIYVLLAIVFAILCASCTDTDFQEINVNKHYKRDMTIFINGQKHYGMAVAKPSHSYKLKIHAKGKLDLLTIASCHREVVKEHAGEGGLFGDRKKAKFRYNPIEGIETVYPCPLRINGYEEQKQRHSQAFIDFESYKFNLRAVLSCNGRITGVKGVSVCQARAGLIQEIKFISPVNTAFDDDCSIPIPNDKMRFQFKIPEGQCAFVFEDMQTGELHRLTTYGYNDILLRKL